MRKIHLKLKGKPICGASHKRPLRFAKDGQPADCKRCQKAASE